MNNLDITGLQQLSQEIISCRKCPRLVEFREKISREKRKQFSDFDYWGKPIPGYGDPRARLIVVGLAPAAHGGNRTGRVFTGDSSAKFLVKHLYEAGFASQPTSEKRDDGLVYRDCYVTAAVRCVPPDNRPTREEIQTCASYFDRELLMLKDSKAILALGKVAFDSVLDFSRRYYGSKGSFHFKHGLKFKFAENFPIVFASYHPSPRNTNTGKLTSQMFARVLNQTRRELMTM
jgi:uracil-DNA glycosylase family 4